MSKYQIACYRLKILIKDLQVKKSLIKILRAVFPRRDMIFVSNGRICRKSFGFSSQVIIIVVTLCLSYTSAKYFDYKRVVEDKALEISNLNTINGYLHSEINFFDKNLVKINNYFESINSYHHFDSVDFSGIKGERSNNISKFDKYIISNMDKNTSIESVVLDDANKKALLTIIDGKSVLNAIHGNIRDRITGLEKVVEITGLRIRDDVRNVAVSTIKTNEDTEPLYSFDISDMDFSRQGGPFSAEGYNDNGKGSDNTIDANILSNTNLNDDISYLTGLEGLVESMPVSSPLDNYYLTSHFGKRIDPIRKIISFHEGLDMAGSYHSEIEATAPGKVSFAGYENGYGNLVEIDHGFGLKTRYGHLNKILVSKGDVINRGDIIGHQGNSGRSTGQHLHYEVRYNNVAYNPNNFLKAGSKVF